jgi:hypothetical protein
MTKVMTMFLFAASVALSANSDDVSPASEIIYGNKCCRLIPWCKEAVSDTSLGDIIFELDASTPTGDNQLLGIEFDGTYFYVTGGAGGADPNKVYVIDTSGNVIYALDQPAGLVNYWGWRDLTWDGIYTGPDRIDTLYGSFGRYVHKFGINFADSTLEHYDSFLGPGDPINRALAYMEDSAWFYTSTGRVSSFYDSSYNYKFSKADIYIDSVLNFYHMYGAAYDSDIYEGGYVWWHSQDYLGSPFYCLVEQMEAISMNFTGFFFVIEPTIINSGIAGGLCFYEGFRGMDVLFALVQGNPVDIIVGIFVRHHIPGIAEKPSVEEIDGVFLSSCTPNPSRGSVVISYKTILPGRVSLRICDKAGNLVRTLLDAHEPAGGKSVQWNCKDNQGRDTPSGVYFVVFEVQDHYDTKKLVLLR